MKVALMIPILVTGGAETMVTRLAVNLDRSQMDVEVISMMPRQDSVLEHIIEDSGVSIHYAQRDGLTRFKAAIVAWKLLNKIKPDVIHSHISATFYALPWAILHGVKVIHTIHTKPDVEFPQTHIKLLKLMVKLRHLILVAVSKENQVLAKQCYSAGDDRVKYVNNPVETNRYHHDANRIDDHIVFINVSRQDENKNQILAVRAMKEVIQQVPNARMVLVGDGTQHENLIREAEALGLSDVIEFPGERHDAENFLAKADVYISMSHREGLPLSMLEGMASGLPVISTDVGGVSDIVRDNGVLIEDDNQKQLVGEMVRFANDAKLRSECGERSLKIAREFDVSACADAYTAIYREAMGKKGKKR